MKSFLLLCLLAYIACDSIVEIGKCLTKIPNYKEEVTKVLEAIKEKDKQKIAEAATSAVENILYSAISCVKKENKFCRHPIKHLQCIVQCGLPDDSPRYSNCVSSCRDENC